MRHPTFTRSPTFADDTLAYCEAELERRRTMLLSQWHDVVAPERIGRIDLALSWLRSGNYGYCAVCRVPLAETWLRADPERMVCRACSGHAGRGAAHPEAPVELGLA